MSDGVPVVTDSELGLVELCDRRNSLGLEQNFTRRVEILPEIIFLGFQSKSSIKMKIKLFDKRKV